MSPSIVRAFIVSRSRNKSYQMSQSSERRSEAYMFSEEAPSTARRRRSWLKEQPRSRTVAEFLTRDRMA